MRVVTRALAQIEILEGIRVNEGARPGHGAIFEIKMRQFIESLLTTPKMCAKARECPRGYDIREGLLEKFPYVVTYRITATEIIILSVVHARRNDKPWQDRIG